MNILNGVDPLAVNGLFAWIFKAIAKFKDRNQISPKYEEFTKMRIFGASQMLVKNSLNTLSKRQIEKVLIRIKNIDLICKGIRARMEIRCTCRKERDSSIFYENY